jgi:hypothetical protein
MPFICFAQRGLPDIAHWFLLLFVFVGALMAGLSLPLLLRRVKPNSLYGFRTPRTLSDENIWYEANAFAGRWTLGLGVLFALISIVLYFLLGANFIVYNVACASVLLVGLLVVLTLSFRHLRSLHQVTKRE